MVPPTRRGFLRLGAGTLSVAVAGCTERLGIDSSDDDDADDSPRWDEDEIITDVTVHTSRLDVDLDRSESVVRYRDDDSSGVRRRLPYVVSQSDVDALEFTHEPPDVDDVRDFLRGTDYDETTVFVHERGVGSCYELKLQYVRRRNGGGFSPQFCQAKRDPSVECSLDRRQYQLTLLRVPESYESAPSGSGRGHSSDCRLPPGHPVRGGEES